MRRGRHFARRKYDTYHNIRGCDLHICLSLSHGSHQSLHLSRLGLMVLSLILIALYQNLLRQRKELVFKRLMRWRFCKIACLSWAIGGATALLSSLAAPVLGEPLEWAGLADFSIWLTVAWGVVSMRKTWYRWLAAGCLNLSNATTAIYTSGPTLCIISVL